MRKQRQDHLSARCVSRAAFDAAGRGQNCHPRTRPLPRRRSWHSTGAWISVFSPAGRASAALFKEIAADFNAPAMRSCSYGCLDGWACQGVLLLNAVLTVERNRPGSHAKRGWEQCTDTLIQRLATRREKLVFMLWGAYAQAKRALIDSSHHLVLEAAHPSPLSAARGFFGCRHF